jgi:hypothetical protein
MRQASIRWRSKSVAELQLKLVSGEKFTERKNLIETCVEPSLPRTGALSNWWMRQKFPVATLGGPASAARRNVVANLFHGRVAVSPIYRVPRHKKPSSKEEWLLQTSRPAMPVCKT